jgi:HTH-type transcriptional regulator/antitoxin HigA
MDIRPIRTDEDHRTALAEIEACWGAPEGSEAGDKLDVLVALVESYEARRWPIEADENFDPIDVLRYAIEELGHTHAELAETPGLALARIGNPGAPARADGRHDSQDQRGWKIPAGLLVRPYKIESAA